MVSTIDFIEIFIYTLAFIIMVIIDCYLYLRTKKIELVLHFFRVQILLGLWMVSSILRLVTSGSDNIWIFVLSEYISIIFVSVEFFAFSYIYKYHQPMSNRWYRLLLSVCLVNGLVLFTNPYHHLFFTEVLARDSVLGGYFFFHTAYSYGLIMGGIVLLMTSGFSPDMRKTTKSILAVGMLMPMLFNVTYVFGVNGVPFDLTPITFNIMLLGLAGLSFHTNYSDIQLMTRIKIMENLYEGIIILDKDNRIIEFNKRIPEITKGLFKLEKYNKFEEVFRNFGDYVSNYEEVEDAFDSFMISPLSSCKQEIEYINDKEWASILLIFQKTYNGYGEQTGTIIKFLDMTEHQSLVNELEEKNHRLEIINNTLNENISVKKRLAVEQERNRASKEVHDILGHSMTIVISLLEIMRSTYEREPSFAREKADQAMEITRKGLKELKQSLTKKKDSSITTEILIEELQRLTEGFTCSGVEVEFITNHYPIRIKPRYFDTIYRICQESMTNALRHGKASKITIAVRFSDKSVDIIIADNGQGCENFVMGNGLKGMKQRVIALDGFFSCGSPDGLGFNLHVTIPIEREMSNINAINESDNRLMTSD